ncbi:MAG: site-specific integrase [Actinobacteria bacterium]|nr:site-specific integrase [Actinomycetota bacterium]
MSRPATGSIVEPKNDQQAWALRIPAYGTRHFVVLGTSDQGWNWKKADEERKNIMADVRRGTWIPPDVEEKAPEPDGLLDPTFHEWADKWFEDEEPGWRPKTVRDNRWVLECHLLPYFGEKRLSEIDIEEIDAYRAWKQKEAKALRDKAAEEGKSTVKVEGALSNNSINKCISRLGSVLKKPVKFPKYKIDKNAALDPDIKAKGEKPARTWLHVEQIVAFVQAAKNFERPLVAVLVGCGLRIGEAVALDWTDVNLSTATIFIRDSKTETGEYREVDIPLGALEELIAWKARSPRTRPNDPVFLSGAVKKTYARQTVRNIEARFREIIKLANEKLRAAKIALIDHITPHGLRRTYASLRAACGDDPVYIAEQGGWSDIRFVYSVYQRASKRRDKLEDRYLVAFDAALSWARIGRYRQTEGQTDVSPLDSIQRVSEESAS